MVKEFPDKILLVKDDVDDIVQDYWVLRNLTQCKDSEYIRKDVVEDMIKTAEDHAYSYFMRSESMKEKLSKLKKLADAMYHEAQYLTTDASRLHKAMEDYRNYTICELKEK